MRNIQQMVNYLQKKLIEHGFIIQRLDAETTKSVYLKLDYGLCNSIRISDHTGKKEFAYRFNILRQMPSKSCQFFDNGRFPRYFYSFDMVDKMIEDILKRRSQQIQRYGKNLYLAFQEKEKTERNGNNRFWNKAKLVN